MLTEKRKQLEQIVSKDEVSQSDFYWIVNNLQQAWDIQDMTAELIVDLRKTLKVITERATLH